MLGSTMENSYDPDSAKNIMDVIRKAILEDTKTMGRRLTVAEALERYGEYGVEAQEVIATMADKGILVKRIPPAGNSRSGSRDSSGQGVAGPDPSTIAGGDSSDLARDIGRAVESIARAIEIKVIDWQEQSRQQEGRSQTGKPDSGKSASWEHDLDTKLESLASRIEHHAGRAVDSIGHHVSGKPRFINEKQAIKEELRRHSAEVGTWKWDADLKG